MEIETGIAIADPETMLNREQLEGKSSEELRCIIRKLLSRIRGVFDELSETLEQKDSLMWEIQYRYVAIEQLLKNREKI